jgi:hypothetical protein
MQYFKKDAKIQFSAQTDSRAMSLFMLGCGGGGDSTTADPVVSTEAVVVESSTAVVIADAVEPILAIYIIEPDPNAIYESTAELIASKSFLLEQEYELAISYKNDGDDKNIRTFDVQ